MSDKQITLVITLCLIAIVFGCKKDKVPIPEPIPELSIWEKVAGDYSVYDSLGIYLYDMSIKYEHSEATNGYATDTLSFENFDNSFDFKTRQYNMSIPNSISILAPNPILDYNNKSWQLNGTSPEEKDNSYANDTLWLRFKKNNLLYYINETTPYFSCNCKQIAVKQ